MPVFKTAVKMIFRYPVYILLYIVMWSFLGLVMVGATAGEKPQVESFTVVSRPFAIIDRDKSEVSTALTEYMGRQGQRIELDDNIRSIQDAIAQNSACYILIIEDGYGAAFLDAARIGLPVPQLMGIYSIEATGSIYLQNEVSGFLNALRINAAVDAGADDRVLIQRTMLSVEKKATIDIVQNSGAFNPNSLFPFYFKYSAYPMTSGISILVALVFSGFRKGGLKNRNFAAPLSAVSINLQVTLACLGIAWMTFVFINLVSLLPIVGGVTLWRENPGSAALVVLAALVYTLLPLAIGFLLSQFNLGETATNGFINIIALALVFLSGIMMGGSSYMDGTMLAIARFTPSYWYSEAIEAVADVNRWTAGSAAADPLRYYLFCLGLMMLFNLAVFSVALLISRLRQQDSDAESSSVALAAA